MKRNISLFYIVRATFLPFFWLPVMYIYLTEYKGLDVAATMFLLGLQELSLIFLEIPTGVVADKISRRFSVALGYLLTALPFVFLPFVNSYIFFFFLFVAKSVGKALTSGADKSLLYDTLLDHGRESDYKVILNKANSLMLGFTAFCILIGGYVAEHINIEHTLWLPFPFMLVGALAVLLMQEPETSKKGKSLQEANYFKHTSQALRHIFRSKYLLLGVLMFSLSKGLAVNMKWFYTPIFEHFDIGLAHIGGFTFGFYILKSIASYLSPRLFHEKNEVTMRLTDLSLALAFILAGLLLNKVLIFVFLLVILFSSETMMASTEEYLHKGISSKDRATAMSIISLFSSVMATIMINGWGIAQNIYSLNVALVYIGVLFAIGFGVFTFFRNSYKS
jgi:MFS family permease